MTERDQPDRPGAPMRSPARLIDRLGRLPRWAVFGLALALYAGVGLLDFVTGTEISLSVFYLLPTSIIIWFAGGPWSVAAPVLAAALWLAADLAAGHDYSHPAIPYWNALVRLGFFAVVSYLLALLQVAYRAKASVSDLKSTMLNTVSHEFANLLTVLKNSLLMMRESETPPVPAVRAKYYTVLDRAVSHLTLTAANFLDLSRMESGHLELRPRATLVRSAVQGVLSFLQPIADIKRVAVTFEPPARLVEVDADPDALSLVVTNLVGNAIKYTPSGGSVTVTLREEGDALRILVRDTGVGIPPEERSRVLEGGFRTSEGQAMAKGYGIGLTVVQEILRGHGSRLDLESAPGEGSCFSFCLAIRRPRAEGRARAGTRGH